ncbi:uncharacterized protein LOC134178014 [Corticium candelabrum]|uniref:uncharacterized protein LOC134178014 n=1 Tax=Corticium candelabrum TaxID=121492 RepID=UPI002E26DE7A|nr:uncharacterized protein LOC134178014 [Corticium candelabrum]
MDREQYETGRVYCKWRVSRRTNEIREVCTEASEQELLGKRWEALLRGQNGGWTIYSLALGVTGERRSGTCIHRMSFISWWTRCYYRKNQTTILLVASSPDSGSRESGDEPNWPNYYKEITEKIKLCDRYQRNAPQLQSAALPLQPIKGHTEVWYLVGMDLIGPFQESKNRIKYVLTITDYFSKYVEAVPIQDTSAFNVVRAIYKVFSIVSKSFVSVFF